MIHNKEIVSIDMDIVLIVSNLSMQIPYTKIEIYTIPNPIEILKRDFSIGIAYLYDCIIFDSKYPSLLRKYEFLL